MTNPPGLEYLAALCGIAGAAVSVETLRALLKAMGIADDDPETTLAASMERDGQRGLPPVQVVWADQADTCGVACAVPVAVTELAWVLACESGEQQTGLWHLTAQPTVAECVIGGEAYRRYVLPLPVPTVGYHRVFIQNPDRDFAATMTLIVAPGRGYTAPVLREKTRTWALKLPLAALRSQRNWGVGDVNDLRGLVDYAADQGVAMLCIGLPSGREWLDLAYLDIEALPDYAECESARQAVAAVEFQARLRALRATDTVDYREVIAAKLEIAELLFAHFQACHAEDERGAAFRAYGEREGAELVQQTRFALLNERYGPRAAWPDSVDLADADSSRLALYAYGYWQADLQFTAVARRALEAGVILCREFTLAGEDRAVWAAPEQFAQTVRLHCGSVPFLPTALRDTAYAPVVAAVRRAMRGGGALWLREAQHLWQQYWQPQAREEGAWVSFPHEDLLAILALESRRQHCMILADASGLDEAARAALERLRMLPFHPLLADATALDIAAVTTPVLEDTTLRGFWQGRDLDDKAAARRFATESDRHEALIARAVARMRLLVVLEQEGLLPREVEIHSTAVPDMTVPLCAAIYRYLWRAPARLVLVRIEDILGQTEAVMPRKLVLEFEQWRTDAGVRALWAALAGVRAGQVRVRTRPAPGASGVVFTVPEATYRLQFGRDFKFRQAARLVTYLHELGISHAYASPYLKARPGSGHGYDIVDHGAINPELGGRAGLDRWVRALARRGMGHILDWVPNHMGVMGADNAWWLDVLENGEAADYAGFFDIDWSPLKAGLHGKVLLPILGAPYGTVLESAAIGLVFDPEQGALSAWYGPHRLPIDPREYPRVLAYRLERLETALEPPLFAEFQSLMAGFGHLPGRWQTGEAARTERHRDKEVHKRHLARLCTEHPELTYFLRRTLAEFNGSPGLPASFDHLHELLERQAYRLAYWRVAADEINYRRFFDINDLAALSMEREPVFVGTHRLVLELIGEGRLHGLRIDHPDGLYDPEGYFRRLREHIAALVPQDRPAGDFYLVAEKILEAGEELPSSWLVQGTTGYDFANLVNGVFIQPDAEQELDRFYRGFSGFLIEFDEALYQAKRLILKVALSAELSVLANQLGRIAESDRRTRDYSLNGLRDALREIIACFPVYRTYSAGGQVSARDAGYIEQAVAEAQRRSAIGDLSVFEFIRDVLLGRQAEGKSERYREQALAFAMKFQQVTAPVTAKGIEDTLFYRYLRLVSLNEVGSDPRRFGVTLDEFHQRNRERADYRPHALLSTSTHDTKRSEDVRARINVLSELPGEWTAAVTRWHALNLPHKTLVEGVPAPSNNDEYLIYQTLVGTWPMAGPDADYRQRLDSYFIKALREAKLFSSWLNPHQAYEAATLGFLAALFDAAGPFLADFLPFQAQLVRPGFRNSLGQLLLKLTVPGVPDIYQGNELWDFSLVDPDNRRPVDYRRRRVLVRELASWDAWDAARLAEPLAELVRNMDDGRIKLYITRTVLHWRRRLPELFRQGGYHPLEVAGARAGQLCAFARVRGPETALVVVPRWTLNADDWAETRILLPAPLWGDYRAVFSREVHTLAGSLDPAPALAMFPVAMWIRPDRS